MSSEHLPYVLSTANPDAATIAFWFVVNIAAVARLSRLIAMDTITAKPRNAIAQRFEGSLVTLATCTWCLSIWFAAGATTLMCFDATRPWWLLIAAFLAISMFAGALVEWSG